MIQFLKKTSTSRILLPLNLAEQGPLPQNAFSPEDEDVPSLDDNDALSPGDDNVPLPNVGTSASARALKRKRVSSRSTDTKATKKRVVRERFPSFPSRKTNDKTKLQNQKYLFSEISYIYPTVLLKRALLNWVFKPYFKPWKGSNLDTRTSVGVQLVFLASCPLYFIPSIWNPFRRVLP